ncbi:MAG: F0F1 ATP synthase subunit delta [Bacteriovorax sp.]|nr:F0F1 ATP synthase subunit delta [Bacteriovorax sp.]
MKEQIIAKAYAQSIVELSEELKLDLAKELTSLSEAINTSNDLETLLFLDVFTVEEKLSVLNTVMDKLNLSQITKNFLHFLIQEKRIGLMPMIFKNVIVIDDHKKGFLRGTIEGSEDSIPVDVKEKLKSYLQQKLGKETILEYIKNENVSAGYKVTVEDLQLDASLENQLEKFKESVLNS